MTDAHLTYLIKECIGMQDFSRVINLVHLCLQTADVPGEIVEFGCARGNTAALLTAVTGSKLWVYDSFMGLPELNAKDKGCVVKAGGMCFKSDAIFDTFEKAKLPEPNVFRGWFNELPESMMPAKIRFAHLDGDLYDSILTSLHIVYPRMSMWAYCVIDDYNNPHLPGVKVAVDEFVQNLPTMMRPEARIPFGLNGKPCLHAYLKKLTP